LKETLENPKAAMSKMISSLDVGQIERALSRAAHRAVRGTPEERSGRFLLSKKSAIDRIRAVASQPGFIHTLSYMIANELIFPSETAVKNRNRFEILSFHEVALLLSLLSEIPLDLSLPPHAKIMDQYERCKRALDDLHKMLNDYPRVASISKYFSTGDHFIESFFYAPSSAFWFDYLSLAPQLYGLDRDFLKSKGYLIPEFAALLHRVQEIFHAKFRDFVRKQRKNARRGLAVESPLECFLYSQDDFAQGAEFEMFVERFAIRPGEAPAVADPVSFHPAKARPAMQLPDGRVFVPIIPMLCEQLFENPFYVIAQDKGYFAANANNRGYAAEKIVVELLKGVSRLNVLTNVKLHRKGQIVDQIDAVALFGATAILFEIKTKRLTEASRLGDTQKLLEDVQAGILDAQQQLVNSKTLVLSKDYDRASSGDDEIVALNDVTQVICVSVMTHEIPSYPLLIRTILEGKNVSGIIPVTIFDVKTISFYLDNAFDFLYYFAVRCVLDRDLMYGTEQALLAFHLKVRLTIPGDVDSVYVDDGIGQNIDANYPSAIFGGKKLTLQFGIGLVDNVIEQLIETGDPSLFRLFSVLRGMSGASARTLKEILVKLEAMLLADGEAHDGSIVFDKVIVTFVVAKSARDAEASVHFLMYKRDLENRFEQEYFVWLLPTNAREFESDRVNKRGVSRLRPHRVAGFAMKQRKTDDKELIAFSPRIPRNEWDIKQSS
jgi:hypothetical protein